MFGKKKKRPETNFDNLKYEGHQYRYSRAERLRDSQQQAQENEEAPKKGLKRFFGKNKGFRLMLVFYVAVAGLIWFYFYLSKIEDSKAMKQSFELSNSIMLDIKLLTNESRHGLNISIENQNEEMRSLEVLKLTQQGFTFQSNLSLTLAPGEFDAFFIPLTNNALSNIFDLYAELN